MNLTIIITYKRASYQKIGKSVLSSQQPFQQYSLGGNRSSKQGMFGTPVLRECVYKPYQLNHANSALQRLPLGDRDRTSASVVLQQ